MTRAAAMISASVVVAGGADEPSDIFERWMEEARRSEPSLPEAAALATVDRTGWPGVRIVLVKGHDRDGLTFFTNYRSDKAQALARSPRAELCFHWKSLGRQVRVRGDVARLPDDRSDAYFRTRDRGSQIGAWASDQSRICEDPASLPVACAALAARFRDRPVPRPRFWGGYILSPLRWEFWLEGPDRIHERAAYFQKDGGWAKHHVYP